MTTASGEARLAAREALLGDDADHPSASDILRGLPTVWSAYTENGPGDGYKI